MKFQQYSTAAVALIASVVSANPFAAKTTPTNAKAAYHSKLLEKAKVVRKIAENNQQQDAQVDLTQYSLRFEKCQFVKSYSQDLADEGADTVLATQRFVLFRLCPSSNCAKSCNSNYGEYLIDMQTYLQYTTEYRKQEQEEMCNACSQQCYYQANAADGQDANADGQDANADGQDANADGQDANADGQDANADGQDANADNGGGRFLADVASVSVDCSTCVTDCAKIQNMEANFYLDATNFINCQQIKDGNDDGQPLYAGPLCASQGSKIKIGVFTDDDCMIVDSTKDVDNYLTDENGNGMKLSHALLKTTYSTSSCISCSKQVKNGNYYQSENQEVCAELYEDAGKCESVHGFSGLSSSQNQYYDASNQLANEDLVCDFISSLKSGTYSQDGEIVIGGARMYKRGGTSTSGGQKFALTFFIIGTVGLAVYAAMLHSQLTRGGKPSLSTQGGAMA